MQICKDKKLVYVFLINDCFPSSPDSQEILGSLHEFWDVIDVPTENPHQWGVLRTAIPHLNEVIFISMAYYIHAVECDIDIYSFGLRNEIDAAC